jgi:hypothetical protein
MFASIPTLNSVSTGKNKKAFTRMAKACEGVSAGK